MVNFQSYAAATTDKAARYAAVAVFAVVWVVRACVVLWEATGKSVIDQWGSLLVMASALALPAVSVAMLFAADKLVLAMNLFAASSVLLSFEFFRMAEHLSPFRKIVLSAVYAFNPLCEFLLTAAFLLFFFAVAGWFFFGVFTETYSTVPLSFNAVFDVMANAYSQDSGDLVINEEGVYLFYYSANVCCHMFFGQLLVAILLAGYEQACTTAAQHLSLNKLPANLAFTRTVSGSYCSWWGWKGRRLVQGVFINRAQSATRLLTLLDALCEAGLVNISAEDLRARALEVVCEGDEAGAQACAACLLDLFGCTVVAEGNRRASLTASVFNDSFLLIDESSQQAGQGRAVADRLNALESKLDKLCAALLTEVEPVGH